MSPSRIDELRRRVQNDPGSIAFAQLAEEYRRSGQTADAIRICRDGLTRHPGYLSARVTLGRALLDLEQLGDARGEFEFVVKEAPENLAAVRGLAEIFHRDGQAPEALAYYRRALALARHDPEIEEIVQQLSRQVGAANAPAGGLSFEEAHQELLSAAERVPLAPPTPLRSAVEGSTAPFDFDRLVAALGSPSAPPQLEAAAAGHAVLALELPDVLDLGPNPFAALEAELRAHESIPGGGAEERPSPLSLHDAVEPASESFGAEVIGVSGEATGLANFAWEPPLAEVSVQPSASAAVDAPPADSEVLPPMHDVAGEAVTSIELAESPESVDHSVPVQDGAPPPPADGDDVLDDLESWLNTLHDRPAE